MPSTGTPAASTAGSQIGASESYTELGPPERTMPAGSYARISWTLAVQGTIALNTCCSRMRRAINCVYWPPKSNTTTPPSSDFGFVFSFCNLTPVWGTGQDFSHRRFSLPRDIRCNHLCNDQIQQFVRHIDHFDDSLSIEVLRDYVLRQCQFHELFLSRAGRNFQFSAQLSIYLHGNFDFVVLGKVSVRRRPCGGPQSI